MAGEVTVKIDEAAVTAYIRTPEGPVGRHLMVLGEAVKIEALKRMKPGFPRDFLGPTTLKRMTQTPEGPMVRVGTDKVKTRPHVIRGNPFLVFDWPKPNGPGGTVAFRSVNHPGSDFTKYMRKILLESLDTLKGRI